MKTQMPDLGVIAEVMLGDALKMCGFGRERVNHKLPKNKPIMGSMSHYFFRICQCFEVRRKSQNLSLEESSDFCEFLEVFIDR